MGMVKTALGLIVFGLSSVPAQAGWENTQWGMSPQDALAAVDGAAPYKPAAADIYSDATGSYAPMIVVDRDLENVPVTTMLLFDEAEDLSFVMVHPHDIDDCHAINAALTERYGDGDVLASGAISITDWVDGEDAIKLTSTSGAICNLSYSAR